MTRPYHATAADRIALTEVGLGRPIMLSKELPDDLARALWWKRHRDMLHDMLDGLDWGRGDQDTPRFHHLYSGWEEAKREYEKHLRLAWDARCIYRAQRDLMASFTACSDGLVNGLHGLADAFDLPAPAALFTDPATERAMEDL